MYIALGDIWEIIVDYVAYTVHVDSARCNICGDQNPNLTCFESIQSTLPGTLALISVDGGSIYSGFSEDLGDAVGAVLRAREYDGALYFGVFQEMSEQSFFVGLRDVHHAFVDALHSAGLGVYVYPHWLG